MLTQSTMRTMRTPASVSHVTASPLRLVAPVSQLRLVASAAGGQSKLYVGNLSWETTKDDLFELFGKYGDVSDVFVPMDRETGRPRGFGFVTIDSQAAQTSINDLNGFSFMGREIRVNEAQDRDAPRPERTYSPRSYGGEGGFEGGRPERAPRPPLDPSQAKLYVGNISWETSREDLLSLFQKYGTVHDVVLPTDRETGRPRGFAFVTVDASTAQDAVRELDGQSFMGRTMRVNEAQEQTEGGFRGGRGGGDGFRGGRGGGDGFRGGRGGFDRGGRGGERSTSYQRY